MNKIYINDNLGAVIENDELVAAYDTIYKLEKIVDSNGVVYLGIHYTYEDFDEDEDIDGDLILTYRDFNDYQMYEWNKYEIIIKEMEINDLGVN